jgi:sigma-B regulation protein RsbU (phosphoserine phosphatase)
MKTTPAPDAPAAPRPVTVLLVDDQPIVAETVRRMLADEPDVVLHYCQAPGEAIETANKVHPTVILQDLIMPDIDGLMLVKFFRANKATRDVPMIVLSSKEEPTVKAQAFALGANDYLVKLPDKLEVVARIRHHSRGYVALLERNEAYEKLAESQRQLAAEVATAARYVQSLLPAPLAGAVSIDWKFVPSTQLGGDMFGYHWLDDGHLAIYLLDVSGHGVGSSLLAVSAANLISSQSLAEVDFRSPAAVLAKLNDVFQMDRQDNKFFTIFYAVYRRADRTLAWGGGGHPDALLHTGEGAARAEVRRLASTGPVIGMLPPGAPFKESSAALGPYARLVLFSDGAFEIERAGQGMWTFGEFVEYVGGLLPAGGSVLGPLLDKARELRGGEALADDFSVVEVQF